MTVAELIEKLKHLPDNTVVVARDADGFWHPVAVVVDVIESSRDDPKTPEVAIALHGANY